MKISVLGNIIDTKNIYRITPISDGCKFDIMMYNQKSFTVYLSSMAINNDGTISDSDVICVNRPNAENDIDIAKALVLQYITKIREDIIKIWAENQSDIPLIEFTR